MAEGEGRSPLRNPAAAALRAPRTARGPPRCPAGTSFPPRLSRPYPAAAGRLCGASRLRASVRPSPTPPPAGGHSPSALPQTTIPGAATSSGLAVPGTGCRTPPFGRRESPGKESHSGAGVCARPELAEAGPARSAAAPPLTLRRARAPQPRPAPSSGRRAPDPAPPPAGGVLLLARGGRAAGSFSSALTR